MTFSKTGYTSQTLSHTIYSGPATIGNVSMTVGGPPLTSPRASLSGHLLRLPASVGTALEE